MSLLRFTTLFHSLLSFNPYSYSYSVSLALHCPLTHTTQPPSRPSPSPSSHKPNLFYLQLPLCCTQAVYFLSSAPGDDLKHHSRYHRPPPPWHGHYASTQATLQTPRRPNTRYVPSILVWVPYLCKRGAPVLSSGRLSDDALRQPVRPNDDRRAPKGHWVVCLAFPVPTWSSEPRIAPGPLPHHHHYHINPHRRQLTPRRYRDGLPPPSVDAAQARGSLCPYRCVQKFLRIGKSKLTTADRFSVDPPTW